MPELADGTEEGKRIVHPRSAKKQYSTRRLRGCPERIERDQKESGITDAGENRYWKRGKRFSEVRDLQAKVNWVIEVQIRGLGLARYMRSRTVRAGK